MVMSPAGLGLENDCASEDQQQLQPTDLASSQSRYYIRTITARVQLKRNTGRTSLWASRQDELIGSKPTVAK
jgi:hypothetical protein